MASNELARVYASSLFDLGKEKNILSDIEEELQFLSDIYSENRELKVFLTSPGFQKESKKDFVNKVFGGKLSEPMVNFLCVLIDNDRQGALPEINEALIEIIDEANNRQRVTVITKDKIDGSLLDNIKKKLKDSLKKEIILEEVQDESILGGIIIKAGDLVIDGSLVKDLKNIRINLLNSKVRSEVAYED